MKILPLALAAALLAIQATPVLAAAEPMPAIAGMGSASCSLLTVGASNPTADPIEVRLELDGVDVGLSPAITVQPGHTGTRFLAYSGSHHVGLRVDGELVFGEYLAGVHCATTAAARGMCHALKWGGDTSDPTTLRLYIDGRYVRSLNVHDSRRVLTPFHGRHQVRIVDAGDGTVYVDRSVGTHCS